MKLREHPYFNYRGMRSWPPIWFRVAGRAIQHPRGEIGVLKKVEPALPSYTDRIFLRIEYDGCHYLGCVFVANGGFCRQIVRLLRKHLDKDLQTIGDLDVSDLL